MEEIKRMIEEAKLTSNTWLGDKGFKGSYIFTKEELLSLLDKVYREGFRESVVIEIMAQAGDIEPGMGEASAWQQLRKAIDN